MVYQPSYTIRFEFKVYFRGGRMSASYLGLPVYTIRMAINPLDLPWRFAYRSSVWTIRSLMKPLDLPSKPTLG